MLSGLGDNFTLVCSFCGILQLRFDSPIYTNIRDFCREFDKLLFAWNLPGSNNIMLTLACLDKYTFVI